MLRIARAVGLSLVFGVAASGAAGQSQTGSLSPLVVESLAPLLASWIVSSRDAVLAEGAEPIPPRIRAALAGYVPESILDRVRWRTRASEMSLPQTIIRFGDAYAVTLDYVVIFQDQREALEDPKLWAHELKHVMQFAEWGVDGFATRYLTDHDAIEADAWEYRWQFMKHAGLIPPAAAPVE
jgi:hypothetical protein